MGEFAVSIEHSEAKSVSDSGGEAPRTPDQALCPWTPLGAPPQTPVIGSRFARSPCPCLPNPKYATVKKCDVLALHCVMMFCVMMFDACETGCKVHYDSHGTEYKGEQSTAVGGAKCLRWADMLNKPDIFDISQARFEGVNIHQAENYCRNPLKLSSGHRLQDYLRNVWCYVNVMYHGKQKYAIRECKVPSCVSLGNLCEYRLMLYSLIFLSSSSPLLYIKKWNA